MLRRCKARMVKLTKSFTDFQLSPTLATNEMVVARRKEGKMVLHMGFGESPFPVPDTLCDALKDAAGRKEYLPAAGDLKLRNAVAQYYSGKIGINPDKYDVIVSPGSKLILYAVQMAVEGDLLMPVPSWVSYSPQAKMLGRNVILVHADGLDEGGYHLCADHLRKCIATSRAEGKNPSKILLNSPNNPTGLKIPPAELEAIAKVCVEEDILIISDEIYGMVDFGTGYTSISQYAPEQTVVTTGLSKHLSLGGWRVGVGFVPKTFEGLHRTMANIASETWSCVPAPITEASVVAFQNSELIEEHIKQCAAIHKLMNLYIAEGLRKIGIDAPAPQGAFYNYPDLGPLRKGLNKLGITTSEELSQYLMLEYGLASLPSTAFGDEPEVLRLRLSGCDYDGSKALEAYKDGEKLDEEFIKSHAPHLPLQVEAFTDLVKRCQ